MRLRRLNVTDLVAGLLVAGATTIYAAGVAGADLGGVRARACALFVLGAFACGVGGRPEAYQRPTEGGRFVAALSAVGVLTLIAGLVAILFGVEAWLTALMVGIAVLWIGATVRHLTTAEAPAVTTTRPRELVKT